MALRPPALYQQMPRMSQKFWEYLAWSFTRHRTFASCPRQYWFQYVGPNDYDVPPSDRNHLWELKKLESISFLRGKIVHDKIEEILPALIAKDALNEETVLTEVAEQVESAREGARNHIVEYQNGVPFSDALFDRLRTDAIDQVSTFLHAMWPPLAGLQYVQHEKFDHFTLGEIPVTVKLDCVLKRPNGALVIVDWKTGDDDARYESRLQLAGYSMWAVSEKHLPLSMTEVELVFLKTARYKPIVLSEREIQNARETMLIDWAEFSKPMPFESYLARPEPRLCTSCRFARVCTAASPPTNALEPDDD